MLRLNHPARGPVPGHARSVTTKQTPVPVPVGNEAPDFTLRDQFNEQVTLSSFRGRRAVLLVFYPATFTGICESELTRLRDDLAFFEAHRIQVMALSVDSTYAQRTWAQQLGFSFPVLSDFWPHGGVAQQYGVFDSGVGRALRASFLIDTQGVIRWRVLHGLGEARDHNEYANAIAALTG